MPDSWRTLTKPQPLPDAEATGTVAVGGAQIHYMVWGDAHAKPVLLLHGGLGAAEDFGGQVGALSEACKVIAIDTRGHGRSTDVENPLGYPLLAGDVAGVMDHLGIASAAVVGWSDGGNIGLEMAINAPRRITRLFALGANYQTSGTRPSAFHDALVGAYVGHAGEQYARISSTPADFEAFSGKVFTMWGSEPLFSEDQLAGISTPTLIAAGVYEEAIEEAHTKRMAELIPGAELLLIGNTSHFALWQDPDAVNAAILEFLAGGGS